MEITPLEIFNQWFDKELKLTKVRIPTACCLSTIGTDNYPNARFVSLKGIEKNSFIVTGTISIRPSKCMFCKDIPFYTIVV